MLCLAVSNFASLLFSGDPTGLSSYQFIDKTAPGGPLGKRLRHALVWFYNFLSLPREALYRRPAAGPADLVVFTDASLCGLGVVVVRPSGARLVFSPIFPDSFPGALPQGANLIFVLEVLAVLVAIRALEADGVPLGQKLAIFVHKNAASSCLIKATSTCDLACAAIRAIWSVLDRVEAAPWFERVRSGLNMADEPSRSPSAYTLLPSPSIS